MSQHTFRICTISNNPKQYEEMKASFLDAGFDERRCRYEVFDNSQANEHDPYQIISVVMSKAAEPYIIFCHQDVLANKGDGFDKLMNELQKLTDIDQDWAVAGNAGCTEDLYPAFNLDDPNGPHRFDRFPQRTISLDENFLVLRTKSGIRCSNDLNGFHLYGTDLCLQSARRGMSCYVINFLVTHLSSGNTGFDFQQSLTRFVHNWNPMFNLCLLQTPCSSSFYLSRSRVVRRLLRSERVMAQIKAHMGIYVRLARLRRTFRWNLVGAGRGFCNPNKTRSLTQHD